MARHAAIAGLDAHPLWQGRKPWRRKPIGHVAGAAAFASAAADLERAK